MQWLGPGSDLLLYNDRGCQHQQQQGGGSLAAKDALCAVIFSIEQRRRVRVLPRAVYAASPDGSQGLSGDGAGYPAAYPGYQLLDMAGPAGSAGFQHLPPECLLVATSSIVP